MRTATETIHAAMAPAIMIAAAAAHAQEDASDLAKKLSIRSPP